MATYNIYLTILLTDVAFSICNFSSSVKENNCCLETQKETIFGQLYIFQENGWNQTRDITIMTFQRCTNSN